jgi:hypothetical protein
MKQDVRVGLADKISNIGQILEAAANWKSKLYTVIMGQQHM